MATWLAWLGKTGARRDLQRRSELGLRLRSRVRGGTGCEAPTQLVRVGGSWDATSTGCRLVVWRGRDDPSPHRAAGGMQAGRACRLPLRQAELSVSGAIPWFWRGRHLSRQPSPQTCCHSSSAAIRLLSCCALEPGIRSGFQLPSLQHRTRHLPRQSPTGAHGFHPRRCFHWAATLPKLCARECGS